jgi:hypothetical protein
VTNPTYTYDSNGNLLTGANIGATWTSFNMVASITRYGNTDRFHYGPDQERIVQESPTTLTLYSLSSGFELEVPYTSTCFPSADDRENGRSKCRAIQGSEVSECLDDEALFNRSDDQFQNRGLEKTCGLPIGNQRFSKT